MPRLEFDAEVGMTAPETAEIRDVVAANWQEAFKEEGKPLLDVDSSTPAGQLVDTEADIIAQANSELLYLSNQLNPRVAEGPWQDALGYIYFLDRKIARPTTVTIECRGLQGTPIHAGAQIRLSAPKTKDPETGNVVDDNSAAAKERKDLRFECTNDAEINADGAVEAVFHCTQAGPKYVGVYDEFEIVTVTPGWDEAVNTGDIVQGLNRESQWDFEARRYASVAKNAHGTVESLQGMIWNIPGVIDCRVMENPTGVPIVKHGVTIQPHSIAISVFEGNDVDIAEAIYLKKDAGCGTCLGESGFTSVTYSDPEYGGITYEYGVIRPGTRGVEIFVRYHKTVSTDTSNVEGEVRSAVYDDFIGQNKESGNVRVGCCQTLYASRFAVAAVKTAGIENLVGIQVRFKAESGQPEAPWAESSAELPRHPLPSRRLGAVETRG